MGSLASDNQELAVSLAAFECVSARARCSVNIFTVSNKQQPIVSRLVVGVRASIQRQGAFERFDVERVLFMAPKQNPHFVVNLGNRISKHHHQIPFLLVAAWIRFCLGLHPPKNQTVCTGPGSADAHRRIVPGGF